eukprot:scaffold122746_cov84-Phaeocystis_antarctica.AAC.1
MGSGMVSHASRSRYIDPGRPPAADGVWGPSIQTSCLALGSRSTAGSCGRLIEENRPAPSTRGLRHPST